MSRTNCFKVILYSLMISGSSCSWASSGGGNSFVDQLLAFAKDHSSQETAEYLKRYAGGIAGQWQAYVRQVASEVKAINYDVEHGKERELPAIRSELASAFSNSKKLEAIMKRINLNPESVAKFDISTQAADNGKGKCDAEFHSQIGPEEDVIKLEDETLKLLVESNLLKIDRLPSGRST